jgi:hypothetical protein
MGLIERDSEDVVQAICKWDPGTAFSEQRCRNSLAAHLRATLPKAKVSVEHPIGRGRADIFIDFQDWTGLGAKVVVELKYDLTAVNEYRRLVGQVADYTGLSEVIVVLCGQTDQNLAKAVIEHLGTHTSKKLFGKGYVVQKPFRARGSNGRFVATQLGGADR